MSTVTLSVSILATISSALTKVPTAKDTHKIKTYASDMLRPRPLKLNHPWWELFRWLNVVIKNGITGKESSISWHDALNAWR